jgi:DNA-directed RNA polymerase specialized sigma24 family protein
MSHQRRDEPECPRAHTPLDGDADSAPSEDPRARSPDRQASDAECAAIVNHAYVLLLGLYLLQYQRLTARERRALQLVEVQRLTYEAAAAELTISSDDLKMVVFRSRQKIHRGMTWSVVQLLGIECRARS